MPGLTIVRRADGDAAAIAADVARLERAHHFPDYRTVVRHRLAGLVVASTAHPAYPCAVWSFGATTVVLEGRIYASPHGALERTLAALAAYAAGPAADRAALARLLAELDGDFVAAIVGPDAADAVVVNDRYGRLPFYWTAAAGRVVASRELSCLVDVAGCPDLRRDAVAQFLLLGYPLGRATLFPGIERLPPASVLSLRDGGVDVLLVHDFGCKASPPPAADAAAFLADALVAACRTRAADACCVLSLSGGVDSRMVAGALRRAGVPFAAASHRGADATTREDARIAGLVAARLGIPWTVVPVGAPTGADLARLLRLKSGANYLGMGRILPYLDALLARFGPAATLFTGDQGDRILGDVSPVAPLADDDALACYIARKEGILPLATVSGLTGVHADDVLAGIHARLRTYPETAAEQRYVHFLFYERAVRWLFEGEDRNRCWFWHVTPFYAPAVFETAMRLPDRMKAGHRLRARVLARLAPEVAWLANPGTRGALDAPATRLRLRAEHAAKAILLHTVGSRGERLLKRLLRRPAGPGPDSAFVESLRRHQARPDAVFRAPACERLLPDLRHYPREQISVLLTVAAVRERLTGGPQTLGGFAAVRFT